MIYSDKRKNLFCKFDKNKIAGQSKSNVDNFVEMVDFSDKLVQKFSTKSMFESKKLVEKLQNVIKDLDGKRIIM